MKCFNCGSESYNLKVIKNMQPIWDGPHRIIGHIHNGAYVQVNCGNCNQDLDPTEEQIDRFFEYRKGVIITNE